MRNFICSLFTCFLWKREVIKFRHRKHSHHTAEVVIYRRPWDKSTKTQIESDMYTIDFEEVRPTFYW